MQKGFILKVLHPHCFNKRLEETFTVIPSKISHQKIIDQFSANFDRIYFTLSDSYRGHPIDKDKRYQRATTITITMATTIKMATTITTATTPIMATTTNATAATTTTSSTTTTTALQQQRP